MLGLVFVAKNSQEKKVIDICFKMLESSYFQLWKDIIYIF